MEKDKNVAIFKFGSNIKIDEYRIFEMPQSVLDEMQELGRIGAGEFQIRGREEDPAVFVTEDSTYSVRYIETSNSVCLVQPQKNTTGNTKLQLASSLVSTISAMTTESTSDEPPEKKQRLDDSKVQVINALVTGHYQLSKIQPRIHVLREMLFANPYTGKDVKKKTVRDYQSFVEEQDDESNVRLTTQALREMIQASDTELYSALKRLNALEVNGQWRVIDADFVAEVFGQVLDTAIAEKISLDAVDAHSMITLLKSQYDQSIITHCIRMHSEVHKEGEPGHIFKLDHTKVSLFYVLKLFLEKEPWQQDELLVSWTDSVPYGIIPKIEMLRGVALSDEAYDGGLEWRYVPVESLSPDAKERFDELLNLRARWLIEDIKPYAEYVLNPGETLDSILLKYTRVITIDDVTMYSRR